MTKSRKPAKKPATPSRAKRGDLTADEDTIRQALEDLGIDRPYARVRVVGGRLELTLYGGDVVTWPPPRARRTRT